MNDDFKQQHKQLGVPSSDIRPYGKRKMTIYINKAYVGTYDAPTLEAIAAVTHDEQRRAVFMKALRMLKR